MIAQCMNSQCPARSLSLIVPDAPADTFRRSVDSD